MKERKWSHSVVSDSLWPPWTVASRLLHPWDFPGNNTGLGYHFLLQEEIFLTQGLNLDLPHCKQMLYRLSHQGSLMTEEIIGIPRWHSGKESVCQCRKLEIQGFTPWVRKIPLEEEMATHSSILAWKIPWTEESGGLLSMGSQRVEHSWVNIHSQ